MVSLVCDALGISVLSCPLGMSKALAPRADGLGDMATMTGNAGNDSISLSIDRALDNLAAIHNFLLTQPASPDSCGLDPDLAQELMTAVDAVRHLLWVYIQDTTPAAEPGRASSSFQQLVSNALAVSSQYSDVDSPL